MSAVRYPVCKGSPLKIHPLFTVWVCYCSLSCLCASLRLCFFIHSYAWAQLLGELGSRPPPKKKLDGPPTSYVAFGGGNRLRQTGYTFLIFFLEKGSNTPDREIGPSPTLKTLRRCWYETIGVDFHLDLESRPRTLCRSVGSSCQGETSADITSSRDYPD